MNNIDQLVELAMAFELSDPIDWGMLAIEEEEAYYFIAEQVLEIINNSEDAELVATVAMTKLLVENFVLNLQLTGILNDK